MTELNPYLNFMGTCGEAMKFYQSIFGGDLDMQTYKDSGQSKTPEEENLIMHAVLKADGISFMAADGNAEHPVTPGNNVHMSIQGDDEEKLKKYFDGLSQGGKVDFPLAKQFWGDTFGMLTDRFGIHWMINISAKKGN